jgi:hypothetical protein
MDFFTCRACLPFGYSKIAGLTLLFQPFSEAVNPGNLFLCEDLAGTKFMVGTCGAGYYSSLPGITGEQDRIAPSHLFIKLLVTFVSLIKV